MKRKSSPHETLERLLSAAREDEPAMVGPVEIPFGFAGRVSACWAATAPPEGGGLLVPSWSALVAALAVLIISLSLNWHVFQPNTAPDVLVTQSLMNSILPR